VLLLLRAFGLNDNAVKRSIASRKAVRVPALFTLPLPANVTMETSSIQGRSETIVIKKYQPARLNPNRPRVLFMHGGGWLAGGVDTLDHLCASVSHQANCLVVSVDYRLSPETPFPGALEDCDDALSWLASDPSLGPMPAAGIVVMGDSAGGNLAAALCVLRAQRGDSTIKRQILLYPPLDATLASESMSINLPGLERPNIVRMMDMYRGKAELTNPLLSPLFFDNFSALPPALLITADIDPIRDDSARYAEKLSAAGVHARYLNYPGVIHGYFCMPRVCPSAMEGITEICKEIMASAKA